MADDKRVRMARPKSADVVPANRWLKSEHVPGVCECPRCTGFLPGNTLSVGRGRGPGAAHGAYSVVEIAGSSEALVDEIRSLLPVYDVADELAIRSLAIVMTQIARAAAALDELAVLLAASGEGPLAGYAGEVTLHGEVVRVDGLRGDMRRWLRISESYLSALGLTPGSRARLGLDLARAQRTLVDLHRDAALEADVEDEEVENG